jgi:hypothetical protein
MPAPRLCAATRTDGEQVQKLQNLREVEP